MKKILIAGGIITLIVLLTILITNIIYNVKYDNVYKLYGEKVVYSYSCCPQGPYFQSPCPCKDIKIKEKLNVLQKTVLVISGKLI